MAKKKRIPHKFQPWIDARSKFKLSNAHIQMARELGLNPKRFGGYAPSKAQPWKLPLTEFIESLYEKRFGKRSPVVVKSMEDLAAEHVARREAQKVENAKQALAEAAADSQEPRAPDEDLGETGDQAPSS